MKKLIFVCSVTAIISGMFACRSKQHAGQTAVEAATQRPSADSAAAVAGELTGRYWRLVELFGEPVAVPESGSEAHIIFQEKDNRVYGNNGCNTFNGSYTLRQGNRIAFGQMVSTLKMCLNNMETETKMKQVLEKADSYTLRGDTLVLIRARMAPLARFTAVDKE